MNSVTFDTMETNHYFIYRRIMTPKIKISTNDSKNDYRTFNSLNDKCPRNRSDIEIRHHKTKEYQAV